MAPLQLKRNRDKKQKINLHKLSLKHKSNTRQNKYIFGGKEPEEEEAATKKKAEEEAAAANKKAEEEAAAANKKAEEEAAANKKAEEEAATKKKTEEEAKKNAGTTNNNQEKQQAQTLDLTTLENIKKAVGALVEKNNDLKPLEKYIEEIEKKINIPTQQNNDVNSNFNNKIGSLAKLLEEIRDKQPESYNELQEKVNIDAFTALDDLIQKIGNNSSPDFSFENLFNDVPFEKTDSQPINGLNYQVQGSQNADGMNQVEPNAENTFSPTGLNQNGQMTLNQQQYYVDEKEMIRVASAVEFFDKYYSKTLRIEPAVISDAVKNSAYYNLTRSTLLHHFMLFKDRALIVQETAFEYIKKNVINIFEQALIDDHTTKTKTKEFPNENTLLRLIAEFMFKKKQPSMLQKVVKRIIDVLYMFRSKKNDTEETIQEFFDKNENKSKIEEIYNTIIQNPDNEKYINYIKILDDGTDKPIFLSVAELYMSSQYDKIDYEKITSANEIVDILSGNNNYNVHDLPPPPISPPHPSP